MTNNMITAGHSYVHPTPSPTKTEKSFLVLLGEKSSTINDYLADQHAQQLQGRSTLPQPASATAHLLDGQLSVLIDAAETKGHEGIVNSIVDLKTRIRRKNFSDGQRIALFVAIHYFQNHPVPENASIPSGLKNAFAFLAKKSPREHAPLLDKLLNTLQQQHGRADLDEIRQVLVYLANGRNVDRENKPSSVADFSTLGIEKAKDSELIQQLATADPRNTRLYPQLKGILNAYEWRLVAGSPTSHSQSLLQDIETIRNYLKGSGNPEEVAREISLALIQGVKDPYLSKSTLPEKINFATLKNIVREQRPQLQNHYSLDSVLADIKNHNQKTPALLDAVARLIAYGVNRHTPLFPEPGIRLPEHNPHAQTQRVIADIQKGIENYRPEASGSLNPSRIEQEALGHLPPDADPGYRQAVAAVARLAPDAAAKEKLTQAEQTFIKARSDTDRQLARRELLVARKPFADYAVAVAYAAKLEAEGGIAAVRERLGAVSTPRQENVALHQAAKEQLALVEQRSKAATAWFAAIYANRYAAELEAKTDVVSGENAIKATVARNFAQELEQLAQQQQQQLLVLLNKKNDSVVLRSSPENQTSPHRKEALSPEKKEGSPGAGGAKTLVRSPLDVSRDLFFKNRVSLELPDMVHSIFKGHFGGLQSAKEHEVSYRHFRDVYLKAGLRIKVFRQFAEGPAIVEVLRDVSGGIKGTHGVEFQITPTIARPQGQTVKDTTFWTETIGWLGRIGFVKGNEYKFQNINHAEEFTRRLEAYTNFVDRFSPLYLLGDQTREALLGRPGIDTVDPVDRIYRNYAKEAGFDGEVTGKEVLFELYPFGGKVYASGTPVDIYPYFFPGKKTLLDANARTSAFFGGYGESGIRTRLALQYSNDKVDSGSAANNSGVQSEEIDPGAPHAITVIAEGVTSTMAGISAGLHLTAGAMEGRRYVEARSFIFGQSGRPAQTMVAQERSLEYFPNSFRKYGEQKFRDIRYNAFRGANPNASNLSLQGTLSNLKTEYKLLKIETRESLASPIDTLVGEYTAHLLGASAPHARITEINKSISGSTFKDPAWEDNARNDFEKTVVGRKLDQDEWNKLLHDALNPFLWNPDSELVRTVTKWGGTPNYFEWYDKHITREQRNLYTKAWPEIVAHLGAAKRQELLGKDPAHFYEAHREFGFRPDGHYVTGHFGTRSTEVLSGGISLPTKTRPKGLRKAEKIDLESHYLTTFSIATSLEAWPHAEKILGNEFSAEGFLNLYDQTRYDRRTSGGELVFPRPPARLFYRGYTSVKDVLALVKANGQERHFLNSPAVEVMLKDDESFDAIGQRALSRLKRQSVTHQEAVAYGQKIRDINFPGKSDDFIKEHMLKDGPLVLPDPELKQP